MNKRYLQILVLSLIIFITVIGGASGGSGGSGGGSGGSSTVDLETALTDFCKFMYDMVGTVAMIMVLLSSIVFALGQLFGAETRARANVWATSMVTGAIIGILLTVLLPWLLAKMLGQSGFDAANCTFT